MDRPPSPSWHTGSQSADRQSGSSEWSIVEVSSSQEPSSVPANTKRKRVLPKDLIRSAASPGHIRQMKKVFDDARENLQKMLPSMGESTPQKPAPSQPMNYVKTTRPTLVPSTGVFSPLPITPQSRFKKKESLNQNKRIDEWLDNVAQDNEELLPSFKNAEADASSTKLQQLLSSPFDSTLRNENQRPSPRPAEPVDANPHASSANPDPLEALAHGVSSLNAGALFCPATAEGSQKAQRTTRSSPVRRAKQTTYKVSRTGPPATPVRTGRRETVLSFDEQGAARSDRRASAFRATGNAPILTQDMAQDVHSGAGEIDSQKMVRFADRSLRDDDSDANLRKLSPHVTPYRKGKGPKVRRPEGYDNKDIFRRGDNQEKN
ncbi:hypothetical protein VTO42DRAFT_1619 [Malbranchea cinnamomea]